MSVWALSHSRGETRGSAVLRSHFDALRRGWSTKSAASSASLRSVLRGVPICARMVRPRAKSVTCIARTATGKSGGMSPALIPSRNRRSTSAVPPNCGRFARSQTVLTVQTLFHVLSPTVSFISKIATLLR